MITELNYPFFVGFLRVVRSIFLPTLLTLLINTQAHWRQTYFRPNKPLPTNVGSNQSRLFIAPLQPLKCQWAIIRFRRTS